MPFLWIMFFKGKPPKGFSPHTDRQQFLIRHCRLAFTTLTCLIWLLLGKTILWSYPAIPAMAETRPSLAALHNPTSSLPVLSIDQAVRMALARNPELKGERARIAQNQARSVEAGELPDPMLVVGEQYFPINFDMGASALTMATVGIRQDFSPWGKRTLLRQSAVTEEKSSRWNLEDKKALLVREIRVGWLDLYQAGQTEIILRSIGSLWEKAFQAALTRYRQGIGSESDVLSAQYQKDALRDKEEQVRIREEKSLYRLMDHMHVSRPFRISLEEPHFQDPLPESVLLKQIDNHPALESQDATDNAQQIRVRSAEKDKIPAVSVEGDYSYFMGPNLITTTPNLFSVLLTFKLPVRPGERQDQRIAQEEHKLERLEADRETKRQRFIEEIRDSEGAYATLLRRTVLLDQLLIPEAKRNVDGALAGYTTGILEMGRVLSAMKEVEKVGLRALSVRVELLKTSAELSYLSGVLQGGLHEP